MPDVYEGVRVRISGRVQGVGFRAWMRGEARAAGLSGWVRNLPGGEVEAVIGGESGRVRQLLDLCQSGPSWARVSEVRIVSEDEWVSGRFEARANRK